MRPSHIRELYHGRLAEAGNDHRAGAAAFLRDWREALGLNPNPGRDPRDTYLTEDSRPVFGAGRFSPGEVTIRGIANAIMGVELVEELYRPGPGGFNFGDSALVEAAIDPTAFVHINVFNQAVSGLVNARILERFTAPEYIALNMVTNVPTNMNGHKITGVTGISPQTAAAKARLPGQAHAEVQFGEAWQTTPETVEQALKCSVTKEAVFFEHQTGEVLRQAGEIGDELRYGQEKEIADAILGVSAGYNRSGTAYNTYQTSSPWINDHVNPFTDDEDVEDARQLFVNMTDPDTGREIMLNGLTILCMPQREVRFRERLFGTQLAIGSQGTNFASRQIFSQQAIHSVGGGSYTLVPLTQIWYNRATAADGLALSAANAAGLWFAGETKRAFEWHENWPLTPWQAAATELKMKDEGLVAVYGANYRGRVFPREPRYIVRNKVA